MAQVEIVQYDSDAQEATVQIHVCVKTEDLPVFLPISNQSISLIAFFHPAYFPIRGDKICLFSFLTSDIVREERMQIPIKTDCGYYSYQIFAKVLDVQNQRVRFGDVDIIVDTPMPRDIKNGDIISFYSQRLDL